MGRLTAGRPRPRETPDHKEVDAYQHPLLSFFAATPTTIRSARCRPRPPSEIRKPARDTDLLGHWQHTEEFRR
jgi:hypothetical protein